MSNLVAVSFGGGVNSTALLVGLHILDQRPDYILFSDTGGEREETYAHVREVDRWCSTVGFPPITTVSNAARPGFEHKSLEDECLNNKTLPSLAYGNKGCSAKWKRQPMDRWLRKQVPVQHAWENARKVERLIGIDAGERHRSANLIGLEDPRWIYRRPLVEWDWAREECIEAIERAGLTVPTKSACWFCPATKKHEVLALAKERPDLFQRAVEMEHQAEENNGVVRGLGRNWSWEQLVAADNAQLKLFPDPTETACGCFDGEDD